MKKALLTTLIFFSLQGQAEMLAAPALEVAQPESKITATATQNEAEIPVHLEATKKSAAEDSPLFKIILAMSTVGVLACGAYFFIKKYTKGIDKKNPANQIKVLTQHYLGPKKSLAIVRVAGESVLIGITEQNISMIKSLSLLDEDIPEETPQSFAPVIQKKQTQASFDEEMESQDDFAISGIKDFVSSKLKNMRSFE